MTSIRGKVVDIIPDYDYKHANFLTKQYMDKETYPFKRPGEKRIILIIAVSYTHLTLPTIYSV